MMTYDRQLNELWQSNQLINNRLTQYVPPKHLSDIVEQYYIIENSQQQLISTYILPDLSPHLLLHQIYKKQGYQYKLSLIGSRTSGFLINRRVRKRTFIIRFRPGVLNYLVDISGKESCNQSLPLNLFFPTVAKQLLSHFQEIEDGINSPEMIFQYLEKYLLEPMKESLPLPKALLGFTTHLKSKESNLTVRTIANKIDLIDFDNQSFMSN